ncbi:MAG: substrate-binding domain-containing protein [Pirellulales bacterium]|nr:substrate-binding domain-containing protein [Pirellulales bacterium]
MSTSISGFSSIHQLAKRLEQDIARRRLRSNDRYLTAAEAGKLLGVSRATADRALKILADNQLVTRRQNLGTFVRTPPVATTDVKIRTVHVLIPAELEFDPFVCSNRMVEGIRKQIRDVNVQFSFIPRGMGVGYVEKLIASSSSDRELVGVVAVSCSREVYHFLAESGVPTVVFGSLYPSEPAMPSVDLDNHEAGRLLARYIVDRGHRRIGYLFAADGRPGANAFYDGISEVLTEARLPHNALMVRLMPPDIPTFSAAARDLLQIPDRPTAFITQGQYLADLISSVTSELGLKVPADLDIVFADNATAETEDSPFAHVQGKVCFEETVALIGRMIYRLSRGQSLEEENVVVPVVLRDAKSVSGID